ncbi:MAG: hypothetical protein JXA04_00385 [Gammaproteobacteria bacterium]|nr:hypothetical protein [Gammaproteobacteria bacterium]
MRQLNMFFVALFVLVLLNLLSGCDPETGQPTKPQDPQWSEYISQHTSGMVSKKSEIRIRFVNDVVQEERIGEDASDILNISPSISANISFNGRREVLIKPTEDLQSGKQYKVQILGRKIEGVPQNLDVYEFSVDVIPRDFEVNILGLTTTTNEATLMGSVVTSDSEQGDLIEKMFSFTFPGQELTATWFHSPDGTAHEFSIANIMRVPQSEMLKIVWDAKPLAIDKEGEYELEVPALGEFKITEVQGIKDDRQYIEVRFSDRLDPQQNLNGLVRLSVKDFTVRVESDLVKIYPTQKALGKYTVTLEKGIRSESGSSLSKTTEHEVFFEMQNPEIKFAGSGVILPVNRVLSVPFEAINVRSVQVTAFKVYEDNIGQFLQANKLDSSSSLGQVGRHLWRKTIDLGEVGSNTWTRYSLDVTDLLKAGSGDLYRLTLSINRENAILACSSTDEEVPVVKEEPYKDYEDLYVQESSGWDYAEDYYGEDGYSWQDRDNPCKDSYYQYGSQTKASRNFIASNIGLIAKRGSDDILNIASTDIKNAQPLGGVKIDVRNFQNRNIGTGTTDEKGLVRIKTDGKPFYIIANSEKQIGYLKVNEATALPISHFDVGGEKLEQGVKGFIYGERGVWRPGDDIFLTFVLEDKNNVIPANHPVTIQLFNPQGQLMKTLTNTQPVGDFYVFNLRTSDDAPTGNWTAKALLGGSTFSKTLKIETVIPNRLKVELNFPEDALHQLKMPVNGHIFSQWLHGAIAANLKVDVSARLSPRATVFTRNTDFIFDDPARQFNGESETIFDGVLDDTGNLDFSANIWANSVAPGMLTANFTTRVFEESGAFSTSQSSMPYHAFDNYIGIKLPKGDATRNMLLTDIKHPVEIASLDSLGEPVSVDRIQVSVYKIDWKWWWDKSGESLAHYASGSHNGLLNQSVISTVNGRGVWEFEIKYPDWGRYLVRACDLDGKHCSGKILYIDWPGWAGRAQEGGDVGANSLTLVSDKPAYKVGETAVISLPTASKGRALISIENGSRVIQQQWFVFEENKTQYSFPVTKDMSPNVYIDVTLVQPHEKRDNDRPIRLYGVIPIKVEDPATRLKPILKSADEWTPASTVEIEVAEESGREMTYTVAIVDEGLLGLTSFATPDLHATFYKKEALGVFTWDLFDLVAGAYGGELERLLSLGGGDEADSANANQEEKRFPPVVRFMGPFKLKAGESNKHNFELPQYIGAVRVMIVAGEQGAYGSADKSVFVRGALSILATVPRVIGPEEELSVPVSVFAMKEAVNNVELSVATNEYFEIVGPASQRLTFNAVGEQLVTMRFKVKPELGKGRLQFIARSGAFSAESEIFIDVRSANPRTVRITNITLPAKDNWQAEIVPHGLMGTNKVTLEVSAISPINLEQRLSYLVSYPHGCVEQTTSSVFPQLYLPTLLRLNPTTKQRVEANIHSGIERLRMFQVGSGAFTYWPGGWGGGVNDWATSYVGHFLIEADKLGYHVPADMLDNWVDYQSRAAQSWVTGTEYSTMIQAYRLYTLALANKPELAAMNRLRESGDLSSVEKWMIASAYRLSGLTSAAEDLVRGDRLNTITYKISGITYGSELRDKAILLNGLVTLGENEKAKQIAEEIAMELSRDKWQSTQSIAYALMAISKYVGSDRLDNFMHFSYATGKEDLIEVEMDTPLYSQEMIDFPDTGQPVRVKNLSKQDLYVNVFSEGIPKAGEEIADAKGLRLTVEYRAIDGGLLNISNLTQGQDFVAEVTVRNLTDLKLENVALTHIIASGWEIHNSRLAGEAKQTGIDYQDIRDDRVLTYFGLEPLEQKTFNVLLNASYLGHFYLPSVSVEAMYDASNHARSKGQWVSVNKMAD